MSGNNTIAGSPSATNIETPSILVVDDEQSQLDILADVTRGIFPGWDLCPAKSVAEAYRIIASQKNILKIAIVDLRLTTGAKEENNGILVLGQLRKIVPNCFNILVSKRASNRTEMVNILEDGDRSGLVDIFVSLRYIDSDPIMELQRALRSFFLSR